jgi:hypothetical protein
MRLQFGSRQAPQAEGLPEQPGFSAARGELVALARVAKVESCSVLRALPHFGQTIFSLLESTSFS